jgi:hypothetical protein
MRRGVNTFSEGVIRMATYSPMDSKVVLRVQTGRIRAASPFCGAFP